MLAEMERKILEAVAKKLLITKTELHKLSDNAASDVDFGIQKLKNMGYIQKVESLGTCFVLTQKGLRAVKE